MPDAGNNKNMMLIILKVAIHKKKSVLKDKDYLMSILLFTSANNLVSTYLGTGHDLLRNKRR